MEYTCSELCVLQISTSICATWAFWPAFLSCLCFMFYLCILSFPALSLTKWQKSCGVFFIVWQSDPAQPLQLKKEMTRDDYVPFRVSGVLKVIWRCIWESWCSLVVTNGNRMCSVSGRAERGEKEEVKNFSLGKYGISLRAWHHWDRWCLLLLSWS